VKIIFVKDDYENWKMFIGDGRLPLFQENK
jgi:hypothetical protein